MLALLVDAVHFVYHGQTYEVRLDNRYAQPLRVYRGDRLVASIANNHWTPWRLDIGDVDQDGKPEFAIGVTKPTRYIKERHRTVFFYSFDGERLTKKWTGSTMGRPLVDFCFAPDKRGVVTLQRSPNGKVTLDLYRWNGFGFEKGTRSKEWETATGVTRYMNKIAVIVNGKRVLIDLGGLQ